MSLTKEQLVAALNALYNAQGELGSSDFEEDHIRADRLLLEYINDDDVSDAFEAIEKWYA